MPRLRISTGTPLTATKLTKILLVKRVISETPRRGIYLVNVPFSPLSENQTYRRANILPIFANERDNKWYITTEAVAFLNTVYFRQTQRPQEPTPEPERPVLRRINRSGYHSQSRNVEQALARLNPDNDGVVRSFGLEYEIYRLSDTEEDKLARLLDTLPPHITERDGSLTNSGVEIVFEPMSEVKYKETFLKLKEFVSDNGIDMSNTGAHTTYGVGNSNSSRTDIQIRLNRYALAVKAVGAQRNIKAVFGRDFSDYCKLPTSTTTEYHNNAFSIAGRPNTCWELRLMNYKANIEKVVEFFKLTETVFYRPTGAQDFTKVFEILGADTDGE